MSVVYFVIQQTMYFAIPLLIVAIGAMYSERSGVINIAMEGIMVMGAFVGIFFINIFQDRMSGQKLLLLAILIVAVAGGLFSLLHAFASINMKADQTISGTALNLFAPAFAIFTARMIQGVQQIQFTDTFHIDKVPVLGDIPVIGDMFFQNCYITTYIGIGIFLVAAYVIKNTRFGLRLRACVAGYGFLAIAVLIFGQWRSNKILMAAFFFGIMKTLASAYSAIPFLKSLPIPNELYKMIPYIATLIVLAFSSKNSQAPRAEGIPYDKGSR